MKQRIPNVIYSKEFREQVFKQVTAEGLSTKEVARCLSLPPLTLAHWVKVSQTDKLDEIGKTLSEVELELAKTTQELAEVKVERDLLKNGPHGIDSRFHVVAVSPGLCDEPVRTFQAFTSDLQGMADWLIDVDAKTVSMESTGELGCSI